MGCVNVCLLDVVHNSPYKTASIGRVIEDLLLVIECESEEELMDRVIYIPL